MSAPTRLTHEQLTELREELEHVTNITRGAYDDAMAAIAMAEQVVALECEIASLRASVQMLNEDRRASFKVLTMPFCAAEAGK